MATGSFYSYYGSKSEIFAAVVRAINTDLRQATAGGRVPDDVLDDVLELLGRGLAPKDPA